MNRRFYPTTFAPTMALAAALSFASAGQGAAQSAGEGPKVGQWKTWHLASADEIAIPAPPADRSDQTKAELKELLQFQGRRSDSPALNGIATSWNGLAAVKRWTDVAIRIPSRLADVLIERRPSSAARSSTPMRLTGTRVRLTPASLARYARPSTSCRNSARMIPPRSGAANRRVAACHLGDSSRARASSTI